MTDDNVLPHSGEYESGVQGFLSREAYCMKRMFRPEFSRPEPTGGTWFQVGPFGMAGAGRPKGKLGPGSGRGRKPRIEKV